jgi:hypothetical protein
MDKIEEHPKPNLLTPAGSQLFHPFFRSSLLFSLFFLSFLSSFPFFSFSLLLIKPFLCTVAQVEAVRHLAELVCPNFGCRVPAQN